MWFSQHSLKLDVLNDYSSVVLGASSQALSLHSALLTFLSARLRVILTIPYEVRCPQCRLLHLGSCVQSSAKFPTLLVALPPLAVEVLFVSRLSLRLSAVECFSNSFG